MDENNNSVEQTPVEGSPDGVPLGRVNINTAELEELTGVPGLGPAMAERIIAARPFVDLGDLQRVSGIGPNVLERLKPYLEEDETDSRGEVAELETQVLEEEPETPPLEEAEVEAEEPEAVVELPEETAEEELVTEDVSEAEEAEPEPVEPLPDVVSPLEAEAPDLDVEPTPEPLVEAQPRFATRGQVLFLALGSSFLALIMALALSLGILASLNNGRLSYASPAEITNINRRVDGLLDQAEVLQQDIGGLRTRLDNLETLGGRVDNVEELASELESDMAATTSQVTELAREAEVISEQVGELQAQTNQFQTFLSGLQELLTQVFEPVEAP